MRRWNTGREAWGYEPNAWGDPAIHVTVTEGGVLVEVTEEHAMDSYNSTFTCSITLPPEKVAELAEVLNKALAGAK